MPSLCTRLLLCTVLGAAGAVCAGTAASVYVAALPRQDASTTAFAPVRSGVSRSLAARKRDPLDRGAWRQRMGPGSDMAARLAMPQALVSGACLKTREVLFGSSPARHAAVEDMASTLAGVPGALAVLSAARATLTAFDEAAPIWEAPAPAPAPVHATGAGHNVIARVVAGLVPDRVERRVALCRALQARSYHAMVSATKPPR